MSANAQPQRSGAESILVERIESIARQQLVRARRRLGGISADQERAVEALLISTIEQIYSPIISRIRLLNENGNEESTRALISILD